MSNQKCAVAFMRSSKSDDEEQNQSIANQYQEIADYARLCEMKIHKTFTSHSRGDRIVNEIFEYCKANPEIEYLLVEKPSRLTRSITEYSRYRGMFYIEGIEIRTTIEQMYGSDSVEDTFEDYLSMALVSIEYARSNLAERPIETQK